MDKPTVIETVGGPSSTRRTRGQDLWTYHFRQGRSEDHQTREVRFENGYAVYVGTPLRPKVSAEEQDRINDETNATEEAQWHEFERKRQERLGAQSGTGPAREDPLDRKLRQSLYGTDPEPDEERRKRAPIFERVQ